MTGPATVTSGAASVVDFAKSIDAGFGQQTSGESTTGYAPTANGHTCLAFFDVQRVNLDDVTLRLQLHLQRPGHPVLPNENEFRFCERSAAARMAQANRLRPLLLQFGPPCPVLVRTCSCRARGCSLCTWPPTWPPPTRRCLLCPSSKAPSPPLPHDPETDGCPARCDLMVCAANPAPVTHLAF